MKYLLLIFFFISSLAPMANAQEITPPSILGNPVAIKATPPAPGPNSEVIIKLESSATELSDSMITWFVNGGQFATGRGINTIQITTGKVGTKTTVSATIQTTDSGTVQQLIQLSIGEIDLLWQGEVYTPPFYKGKSFWPEQGLLTVQAVPNVFNSSGQKISQSNLVYRWYKNGSLVPGASGVGKSSFRFQDSILSTPQTIRVDILINEQIISATASLNISPTSSRLLIYEDSPLYGFMFSKEVSAGFNLKERELTFQAFPLFFSVKNRDSESLTYNWRTGRIASGTKSRITFRAPDNAAGNSQVSLKTNSNLTMQSAERNFLVQFNDDDSI